MVTIKSYAYVYASRYLLYVCKTSPFDILVPWWSAPPDLAAVSLVVAAQLVSPWPLSGRSLQRALQLKYPSALAIKEGGIVNTNETNCLIKAA